MAKEILVLGLHDLMNLSFYDTIEIDAVHTQWKAACPLFGFRVI